MRRTVLTLAATASLAAAWLALAPAATAAEGTPVVIDCAGKGVAKPKQIVLACADAGVAVTGIRWTRWTMNSATGVGTLTWNTCLPQTCSDGIVQEDTVDIRLGRVASGPGVDAFSRMTLTFPDGGPAMLDSGFYTMDFGPQS